MAFLSIVISLLIDRFFLESDSYRQHHWFKGYAGWVARRTFAENTYSRNLGLLLILAPLLLIVAWLQTKFDSGLLGLAFNSGMLLLCLGPMDLDRQVNAFLDADDKQQVEQGHSLAGEIIHGPVPEDETQLSRVLAESIFIQACSRIFGVLFWFLLLGPMGAVLFRLTQQLLKQTDDVGAIQHLLNILNWIPARLSALAYGIGGSFDDALHGWRQHYTLINQYPGDSSAPILAGAGMGALKLNESDDGELPSPAIAAESALNLVWRASLIWVGLLGFAYLINWIS
jgi:membrane protein required for beta-lactamase induction